MNDLGDQPRPAGAVRSTAAIFMRHVYTWMTVGLAVTGVIAWVASTNPTVQALYMQSTAFLVVLFIATFGLVMVLSAAIHKLSSFAATGMFILYSVLNGMTLSVLLLVYTSQSVFTAFLTTAGMFGAMSVYGLVTKRDLTGMGSFMMMGLFGIIIAMVVNLFVGSSTLDLGISVFGVFIFLGLTAFATQALSPIHF